MPRRVSVVGWWGMPDKPCHLGHMKVSPWKGGRRNHQPLWSPEGDAGSPLGRREASPGPVHPPPGSPPSSCRPLLCPRARTRCHVTVLLTASCRLPVLPVSTHVATCGPPAVIHLPSPGPSPHRGRKGRRGERGGAEGRVASVPGACDGPGGEWKGSENPG